MALAHYPQIIRNGLVLCLDAANSKSYPGTGTTWSDLSGNGYVGRWIGNMGPVLLYKKALSADEVFQNYVAIRGRYGL